LRISIFRFPYSCSESKSRMDSFELTDGAIARIHGGDTTGNPVVQVMEIKKIAAPNAQTSQDKYRLVISDGQYFQQALMGTQLNSLVTEEQIRVNAAVRLNEFLCNVVQNRRIIIILNIEVVGYMSDRIGQPVSIEAAGAPKQQAPPQNQKYNPQGGNNFENQKPNLNVPPQTAAPMKQDNKSNFNRPGNAPMQQNRSGPGMQGGAPTQRGAGGYTTKSDGAGHYSTLKSINPYNNRWTIRARVTVKGQMKTWTNQKGSGKLFSVDLLDDQGSEMRATAFNDAAERFYNLLETDKVYIISKGQLKVANKQYSRLNAEYEMTLNNDTSVELADDDGSIKRPVLNAVPIKDIENLAKDAVVDILAVAQTIGPLSEITSKTNGNKIPKRDLNVCDSSGRSIALTLWGAFAERTDWDSPDLKICPPVIAIRGARVGDFGGRSLSTVSSSTVELNPTDVAGSGELRSWFDESQGQGVSSLSSAGGPGQGQGISARDERKVLSAIKDEDLGNKEKADVFVTRATIIFIKHDANISYQSCPQDSCKKKMTYDTMKGAYYCEKCQQDFPECENRYILSFNIADHTASQWVSCFNEEGKIILQRTANEMAAFKESDPNAFEATFSDALFSRYNLKIRAKSENYNDENRVKCSIIAVQPINYATECNVLLDEIHKLMAR